MKEKGEVAVVTLDGRLFHARAAMYAAVFQTTITAHFQEGKPYNIKTNDRYKLMLVTIYYGPIYNCSDCSARHSRHNFSYITGDASTTEGNRRKVGSER